MSNFTPYSSFSVASLGKETTAGTAVLPDQAFAFLSENITPSFTIVSVQENAGERIRDVRSVPGKIEISGDIEFYVEPSEIGHFLRSLLGAPTSQVLVAGVANRHVFEVSDSPLTYTIDIQPGNAPWVHRFFGCYFTKLAFSQTDNLIKCVASVMPRKALVTSQVTVEVSSGSTLTVTQTSGLTTSDTILVLDKDDGYTTLGTYTIASIDSETQLTLNETIAVTLEVDDIMVIKKQSLTYDQELEFTFLGGVAVTSGADVDNTATENTEDFTIDLVNDTDPRHFCGVTQASRYPGDILIKGFTAGGSVMKFYESQTKLAKAVSNTKLGIRYFMQGATALAANSAVKAKNTYGSGDGFSVEASTAGRAGNDINVTIVINDTDDLAVEISGNNVLIELASTTASKNTGTLIAAALDSLSGIDSVAVGAGTDQFTTAEANENLGFRTPASDTVGRDASEKPHLQFDFADGRLAPYFPGVGTDSSIEENIPLVFYKDTVSGDQKKDWLARVMLVNDITSY
jgi:hypothetical protein